LKIFNPYGTALPTALPGVHPAKGQTHRSAPTNPIISVIMWAYAMRPYRKKSWIAGFAWTTTFLIYEGRALFFKSLSSVYICALQWGKIFTLVAYKTFKYI
jgi:hypothetical protein